MRRKQALIIILLGLSTQGLVHASNPELTSEALIFRYHNKYAKTVYLKSSFDHWHLRYPLEKKANKHGVWEGDWILELSRKHRRFQLKQGTYEYKFMVDGEYTHDPDNQNQKKDALGTYISLFTLDEDLIDYHIDKNPSSIQGKKHYYRFIYKSFQAKEVYIVGSFNHWNSHTHPLTYLGNGFWNIELHLPPGKYYYKLLVDQKWINDPLNSNKITNVINQILSYFEIDES